MAEAAEEHATAGARQVDDVPSIDNLPTNGDAQADGTAEAGNKFQQAIAAWRTLDLTSLVSTLDTAASELVTQQQDSMVQRKDLAQKTKDFRKLDDASKLTQIKDLLKAYQGYIDVLTNHNKTINSAFMHAYSPLSEAPDPYPLLEASIDSLVTAEEIVPKLETENDGLQKQVSKLSEQLEDTERQLEEERTKRQSFEGSQDSKLKEVEESWSAVVKEKEENWAAKEMSLEEKVENQDRLLKELKASYEVSQRLDKSGEDAHEAARSSATAAELELVSSELEKSNTRLADLEARNEQLRVELAQTAGQAHSSGRSTNVEDDPAYLRLRSENSSLLRRLESARHEKDSEKSGFQSSLRRVEREVEALTTDRDALQSKVRKWSDYEEVKRELDMLRAIEFASVTDADMDANDDDYAHTNGSLDKAKGESLERLLLARNKKLTSELTELRVSHQEMQQRLDQLQEDLSTTNMDLEKTRNLNATLENDLLKTQQEASNAFETMSVAGTYTSRYPKSTFGSRRGGGGTSPTSSIIGGFDPQGSPRTLESLRASEAPGSGGGSGILPMVTAQRDRFKKKIGELEHELQKQYSSITALRSEVSSLQKDNLTLYEKTRYVSSYSRTAASGASYAGKPNPSTISVGAGDTTPTDRYRTAYESHLSPFAAFRGRESARAFKRMSLPERAIFQITRMVLATRASRNLFAIYCLALHLLILGMLWSWAGGDLSARTASGVGDVVVGSGVAGLGEEGGEWRQEGFDANT
ncbi:Golgi membrane protein [Neohortaea acidophila]|uniref:Protein CASP n=1 Tax=Neohortaea acidophila TaxID=245834 RepID=A0A6A6PLD9_9PEZI|nr:Golgi membrane protein [Neohortaea acidophila]KAF2480890.1 Golgi membrane protein [Neohortaea acidophila]